MIREQRAPFPGRKGCEPGTADGLHLGGGSAVGVQRSLINLGPGASSAGAESRKLRIEYVDEKGARTAHDCGLDEAKVHFFGENLAVVYGREHAVGKDKSQPSAKVCQVWTDTWLKRGGKWQIIASQDNRVECK